ERDKARKEYSTAFCTASTEHFKEFCNRQSKEDVWSVTNRIIKTKPLAQPPSTLRLGDGSFTSSTHDTADALINNFFPDDTTDDTESQKSLRTLMTLPINTPLEPDFTSTEILNVKIITPFYHPIGLINVLGKLLERLIIDRLTFHLNRLELSNPRQFGFKQQTSTSVAIQTALNFIKSKKAAGEHVIAVSLDIKAAFDNAWWPAVFSRLRHYDCPSNIYKILISYVDNRTVGLDFSDISVTKTMSRGCVQGSVCGPTMWNLIMDELLDISLPAGCHIQAYADDVLLINTPIPLLN
ncbi:unnamed protein product, partial [Leptosia nina]